MPFLNFQAWLGDFLPKENVFKIVAKSNISDTEEYTALAEPLFLCSWVLVDQLTVGAPT